MRRLPLYIFALLVLMPLACCSQDSTSEPEVNVEAAISWIDDDFTAFDRDSNVSARYQLLHDWALKHGIFPDIALVPFAYPANSWLPQRRISTAQQWQSEGFHFLPHPVHDQGWYRYDATHPHDASKVEAAVIDCDKAFELYGLDNPHILVWPGNSYIYGDNYPIVERYYDCAITSTYNEVNHLAKNDRYMLKRLSFESLKTGELNMTQFKRRIKKAVDNGDWIIFASHFYDIELSDNVTETGYTTANVFALLEYAHSLCPVQPTATVWNNRKHLWTTP